MSPNANENDNVADRQGIHEEMTRIIREIGLERGPEFWSLMATACGGRDTSDSLATLLVAATRTVRGESEVTDEALDWVRQYLGCPPDYTLLTQWGQMACSPPRSLSEVLHGLWSAYEELVQYREGLNAGRRASPDEYPLDCLPPLLGEFSQQAAASVGVNLAAAATAILPVVAGAVGTGARLRIKSDYRLPAIVWASLVGSAGTRKSPLMGAVCRPLESLQRRLQEEDQEEYRGPVDPSQFGELPPEDQEATKLVLKDATYAALEATHAKHRRGFLLWKDELSGLLKELSADYGGGAGPWLSLWSGESVRTERISRRTAHLDRTAVSVLGAIPPSRLSEEIGAEHLQDGFLQRFLLADVYEVQRGFSWDEIDDDLFRRFRALLGNLSRLEDVEVRLSSDARTAWETHVAAMRDMPPPEDDAVADAAKYGVRMKYEGMGGRLALLHHLCEGRGNQELQADSVQAGSRLARWYLAVADRMIDRIAEHSRKLRPTGPQDIYGDLHAEDRQNSILYTIRNTPWPAVTARHLIRTLSTHYRGAGASDRCRQDLARLIEDGMVESEEVVNASGRRMTVYRVAAGQEESPGLLDPVDANPEE